MAAFMVGEVIVAIVSGSLALLSDAGHMFSDVGAIGAAVWAINLAARPATGVWTFGWKRAEILSAAGNGITLLVVWGIVGYEAVGRLLHPPSVDGGPVLVVASEVWTMADHAAKVALFDALACGTAPSSTSTGPRSSPATPPATSQPSTRPSPSSPSRATSRERPRRSASTSNAPPQLMRYAEQLNETDEERALA